MSAAIAHSSPARTTEQHPRHIEIVTTRAQRNARPKLVYALVAIAGVFGIFIAQLLLSIAVSDSAYQIAGLQGEHKELLQTQEELTESLDLLQSPQHLAANAVALGMVPSTELAFLRLSDNAVMGAPGATAGSACTTTCDAVANSLLAGVPIVGPTVAGHGTAAGTGSNAPATGSAASTPPASPPNGLPSPVTH